ncbi:MAG: sigma-70 family RNA polymerase sigma factor [Kofleriaceae bacterium]
MVPVASSALASPPVLARIAAGEPEAIRECLARYGGLVWSIARRFDPLDAEDAVQEVFLDLWKSAARFDARLASEPAFVAMVARRRLIDRRRSRGRRPTLEGGELPSVADDALDPHTCAEAAQAARALAQLRPEQRQVLVLSACHGMSHSEIAERTGLPLGTVKAHARRGLLSVRSALLGVQQEEHP